MEMCCSCLCVNILVPSLDEPQDGGVIRVFDEDVVVVWRDKIVGSLLV